jgi:ATP-dependent DNA helicase RecG
MKESQHTEWKESWRDEFLKWVCGFANAEGGVLVIGKTDKGVPVGVPDAKQLLEVLPNKIRDVLGIMADVRLARESGKELIEIRVAPYPYPVSYKGEYHYRSGSTKQELKGAALDRFLLKKQGRTWDGVPVPDVTVRSLSKAAIDSFRLKARHSLRMNASDLKESMSGLVEKLHLYDGKHLKRAAVLLFHPEPEKFVTGALVKIGFFRTNDDLLYHDEIHGDLFTQTEKTIELLQTKYLKAAITYRGLQRVETLPVPETALREAVLNAIIHKEYSNGAPIQISVYADKLMIWNPGHLPETWTVAKLKEKHSSQPPNPSIAGVFFRAGEIEAWGRGIERIFSACRAAKFPEPVIDHEATGLWITFPFSADLVQRTAPDAPREKPSGKTFGENLQGKATGKKLGKTARAIVELMRAAPKITVPELAEQLGKTERAILLQISGLKEQSVIRRVGPDKGGHWEVTE